MVFVSPFLFNDTYGLPVLAKSSKFPNQVFYDWFVDIQKICVKYVLETCFSSNENFRKCFHVMKHGWIQNPFRVVNNKKWRKWCEFVSLFVFNNT
jgi:hypothetical protein